ncbi:lipase [Clavibacter lycopersici]|nr:lipase [Clavibacter lycopersici]
MMGTTRGGSMAARTRTTVLLGDSLTGDGSWGGIVPGPADGGDGGDGGETRIVDLGRAGQTTDDVLALLPEAVAADPSTVVVSCGTHDLGAARRGPEATVRALETILAHLRRDLPAARVVVLSVPPRGREHAERIRVVNVHIRQYAPVVRAVLAPVLAARDDEDGSSSDAGGPVGS